MSLNNPLEHSNTLVHYSVSSRATEVENV